MKKIIIPMLLSSLLTSVAFADSARDAAPLGDSKFEAKSDPAHISFPEFPNIVPDKGILSVKHNDNGETKVLLELGYDNDGTPFYYNSDDVVLPMQVEITSRDGGEIDIEKARIAVFKMLEDNTGIYGYDFTADFGEVDHTNKLTEGNTFKRTKLNLARFIPTFSFSLDGGENVVIMFKANIAVGIANNYAEINGIDQTDDQNWSIDYGASAGVRLMKVFTVDSYYENLNSSKIDHSSNGVRAKYALPNISVGRHEIFESNSVNLFRECTETSFGGRETDDCTSGLGFQLGF